jgi:hypothetical protein
MSGLDECSLRSKAAAPGVTTAHRSGGTVARELRRPCRLLLPAAGWRPDGEAEFGHVAFVGGVVQQSACFGSVRDLSH